MVHHSHTKLIMLSHKRGSDFPAVAPMFLWSLARLAGFVWLVFAFGFLVRVAEDSFGGQKLPMLRYHVSNCKRTVVFMKNDIRKVCWE